MDPSSPTPLGAPLEGVEALIFDVFGTTVDYKSSVANEVERSASGHLPPGETFDWIAFTWEWRSGYLSMTKHIANGGDGPSSVDMMHRQILEEMLSSPRWKKLGSVWDQEARDKLNLAWHRLHGWPDTVQGLNALRKRINIVALSNGNLRLLMDMAKFASLPWDLILSAELFSSYKPNVKVYQSAAYHLSLPPQKCAMVAAHVWDLRGAANAEFKTIYVRRPTEDSTDGLRDSVKSKAEGGEVDVVVDSFIELAELLEKK